MDRRHVPSEGERVWRAAAHVDGRWAPLLVAATCERSHTRNKIITTYIHVLHSAFIPPLDSYPPPVLYFPPYCYFINLTSRHSIHFVITCPSLPSSFVSSRIGGIRNTRAPARFISLSAHPTHLNRRRPFHLANTLR